MEPGRLAHEESQGQGNHLPAATEELLEQTGLGADIKEPYFITSPAVDDANVIAEFGGLIDMNYETRNKSFDNADRIKLEEAEGYVLQTLAVSAQASLLFSSLTNCHCPPVTSQAPPHFQIR